MTTALPLPATLALDGKRIVANAFVIALHLGALALLMMPTRWEPPPQSAARVEPLPLAIPVDIKVIPPTLPPQPRDAVRRPNPTPARAAPTTTPPAAVDEAPVLPDAAPIDATLAPSNDDTGPVEDDSFGAGLSTLSYAHAPPPRYPPRSLRAGEEGVVLLRVLVDASGGVQQVLIERSSGHRQLDLAAARQVQSRWRFLPALRDGQPISAWGLVPIAFSLPR